MASPPLTLRIPLPAGAPLELSIEVGSIFFLVGPNGSGKSALVSYLAQQVPGDRFKRISAHRQNWWEGDASTLTPANRISMQQNLIGWGQAPQSRYVEIGGGSKQNQRSTWCHSDRGK